MNRLTRIATPLIAVAIMSSVPSVTLAQNSLSGDHTQNTVAQDWTKSPVSTPQAQQGYRDGLASLSAPARQRRR
jgi:hypothetical protein